MLQSGPGDIDLNLSANKGVVTLKAATNAFDLSKITAQNNLGNIAANLDVTCQTVGNDIKTADFNADISSFEYNGYRYNNISAIGNYNN